MRKKLIDAIIKTSDRNLCEGDFYELSVSSNEALIDIFMSNIEDMPTEKKKSGLVKQVIPKDQVDIIHRALNLLEKALADIPKDVVHQSNVPDVLFDIQTLIGLFSGEVSVEHPKVVAYNFVSHHNVDWPDYGDTYPLIEL